MQNNQDLLEKREDWKDKVRIIGLSIDTDVTKLRDHVKQKKWELVDHYWVRNGQCIADQEYGGVAVPHVVLTDKSGKIVFMGHPGLRDLQKDIDDLLEGKTLEGDGTLKPKEVPEDKCKEADIEKFKQDTLKFTNNIKDDALGMQRAFLVLTCDRTMDFKKNEFRYSATTHTVLVGPKDKVEKLHGQTKAFGESKCWENRDQIQPQN